MISTQAAERDPSLCPMVHASAMAEITASLAAITHMQLATAVPAAQQTRQEKLPAAHRPFYQRTFAGRIVGDHALVPLELAPRDVSLVPVREQHSHSVRGRRNPRLTRLRPSSTLTLLVVRPKA